VKHQKNEKTILLYLYTQKAVNKGWKIIVFLMCCIKYSTVFNEKLKAQAKQFFWFARMECENVDVALMHHLL
jgi:hypothetical protein